MVSAYLGKRYERLLFFTAPISLAALIVLVVALASNNQKERVEGKCFETAANVFSSKLPNLKAAWESDLPVTKSKFWGSSYKYELQVAWIYSDHPTGCYGTIKTFIENNLRQEPQKFIEILESNALELLSHPLSMYGVQLPNNTTITLLGTEIQIQLISFTKILQTVLLPVLLLWLGSIYATRVRETVAIGQATSLLEVFPHIINMYPQGKVEAPRKRNRLAPFALPVVCLIFAFIRIGLLSIFVLPPVAAYLTSLYLISNEEFELIFLGAGFIVLLFFLTTLLAELHPQHLFKLFPSPIDQYS